MLYNEEQYFLLIKLQQYLTIVSYNRPTVYDVCDIEKLSKSLSKGACSGLVILWLYYQYRNKGPYFHNAIMMPIFTWDGTQETLSAALEEVMEYALSVIVWLQAGGVLFKRELCREEKFSVHQTDYDLLINLIKQNDYPSLRKEYEIAFVFKKDELATLLEDLPANKLIRICSDDHVIGLFNDDKTHETILFDPNGFILKTTEEYFFEKRFSGNEIENLITDIYDIFLSAPPFHLIGIIISVFDSLDNEPTTYLNRVSRIKKILDKRIQNKENINIDAANFYDEASALYLSATVGHLDTVAFLLHQGARVDKMSKSGLSPIHSAAQQDRSAVVKMLLNFSGIPQTIDAPSQDGCTALYAAADSGCVSTVELLLSLGANVKQVANDSWSPIHIASQEGHVEVVDALLRSPDRAKIINARLPGGSTPLNIAVKNNRSQIVRLLLKKGADLKKTTHTFWGPLHIAAYAGYRIILAELLKSDVGKKLINTPLLNGDTPVCLAAQNGHYGIVQFLLKKGANLAGYCLTWMGFFQENKLQKKQALLKAKSEVPKNWIDKDHPSLVQIKAEYLLAEKKVNILELEVRKISQELLVSKKLKESSTFLEARWERIAKLEELAKEVETLQTYVCCKIHTITVDNISRKEKLVVDSEKMFYNLLNKIKRCKIVGTMTEEIVEEKIKKEDVFESGKIVTKMPYRTPGKVC